MDYCVKCGLPETFQGITISEDHVCNYCQFYEQVASQLRDQDALHQQFVLQIEEAKEHARKDGAQYDCLVGLSGGKDSTYIIYQLIHTYKMRVLAFTYDNGFETEYGRKNVQIALDKLNVDHIHFSMNRKQLRSYNQAATSLYKNFCMMCFHLTHYYSHLFAAEKRIPLVVNGRTKGQIMQFADSTHFIEPFEYSKCLEEYEYQMFKESAKKAGKLCKNLPQVTRPVKSLSYFVYHEYNPVRVMDFLEKNLGWVKPKAGVAHADCLAHYMAEKLHMDAKEYPIMTGELAYMVRSGEITLEEAKEQLLQERTFTQTENPTAIKQFQDALQLEDV